MTPLEEYNAAARRIRDNPRRRARAWDEGELWWLLDFLQFALYQHFYQRARGTRDTIAWNIARRVGKTFLLLVLAVECALRAGGRSVKYAAQTQVDVHAMIRPSLRKLLSTAPEHLRPKPKRQQEGAGLVFKRAGRDDSFIDIAGCDNGHHNNLRGQEAHLWIVDEGGFVDVLRQVVDDVLWPQTWTTGACGIIASSPPETPGHAFQAYYLAAKAIGASARHTFWETPRFTEAEKWDIVDQGARMKRMTREEFMRSTVYLREFMAEFVVEETRAVLPEMTESLAEKLTKAEESTPLFADWYTVIDLGGSRDPTGIMTNYWDFRRGKDRVQRFEKLIRPTTEQILNCGRTLERETFGLLGEGAKNPLRGEHWRILDDDMGVVRRDLATKYDFPTLPPKKDDKDAGLMDVRDALRGEEIEFDPAAREAVAQCQAAIWNKQHTEYERVEGFGHFEAVDCLLYGHRNMLKNKGRVPHLYGVDLANTIVRHRSPELSQATEAFQQIFGRN